MRTMAGGQIMQIVEQQIGPERCELRPDGELDLWTVERLQAVLQRVARENKVIVVGLAVAGILFDTRAEAIAEPAGID
jgi:hypothetical protein